MSNYVTIARPYAKAIFEHAKSCEKLKEWSAVLNYWALVVCENNAVEFITNPATLPDQKTALLTALVPKTMTQSELPTVHNFISLLADNKRLFTLPAISVLFEAMRAE